MADGTAERTGNFRMTLPRNEDEFAALEHLSDEEKALGVRNMTNIAPSDGWLLMGNDPEAQALWHIVELALIKLLEPDSQLLPHTPANLICFEVARHTGNEWMRGIMGTVTKTMASRSSFPHFDVSQMAVYDHPDSKLWNDEQRLALRFTRACLENTMTDELFGEARETWGEKRMLRYILWIGYVYTWSIMENACNLSWEHGPSPSLFAELNLEVMAAMKKRLDDNWEGVKKLF